MRYFLSRKRKILAVACTAIALAIIAVAVYGGAPIFRNRPSVSPSSTEEGVDTGLSLAPPASSTTSTASSSSIAAATGPLQCSLSLSFAVTGGDPRGANTVTYALTAKDTGTAACQGASISVYYASDETYSSSDPAATADGYYWALGDIAPGKEVDISLTSNRTATLAAGASPDEACLSAANGADACANAGSASQAAQSAVPAVTVAGAPPSLTSFPSIGKEVGVWEWTSPRDMTRQEMQEAVDAAAANGFTAIYLTVDDYLAQGTDPKSFEQSIGEFLALAAEKGLSVDAEAGAKDWASPGNTSNAGTILSFVATYNATHPAGPKFRGVQFDIEPYLLPQYATDESGVLADYVDLVDGLVQQDKPLGVPLTIIVPHFYGSADGWTPEITADGTTDYTYNQIVRLLNELPPGDGRIIEMSYRNTAGGANGAIALSNEEVHSADASHVQVIIAQETGPVSPAYVTFYGKTRADLFAQIAAIDEAFASDTSFGGVAIDYLDPFLELK